MIPRTFDADEFFRNTFGLFVGKGQAFRFRVRFSPEVSDEIREMVWHPHQSIETEPDGAAILELPAESVREAKRFILSYGRHATALAPPELVADMADETRRIAAMYSSGSGKAPAATSRRKKPALSPRS